MLYVAIVITFSVFLGLLWNYSSLVYYKLNIFRPPRVNQFDICALLVWKLRQVHTVKLNGVLWFVGKPTFW